MKELLQKLDAEYGFQLTEQEIDRILSEVRQTEALFQQLNAIDVSGIPPFMRLDVKGKKS
jgi:Asp-tRNA(Asn)/Glu-tRNA(Gln) amidotransferase C subunit